MANIAANTKLRRQPTSGNAYPVGGPDFAPDLLNNVYFGDRRYPYTRD